MNCDVAPQMHMTAIFTLSITLSVKLGRSMVVQRAGRPSKPSFWLSFGDIYHCSHSLDDLRERHMKRSPGKPFVEPESHRTARSPAVMIMYFSPSPTRPSPRENQLRFDFREEFGDDWVWDAANKDLDNDGYYQQLYHAGHFNTRERLEILRKALPGCNGRLTTLGPYPRRPTTPLPASEPTNALRAVLARVPKKPEDDPTSLDNIDVPVGLKVLHNTSPGEPKEHDWNDETSDDIYRALTRVVQELGVAAWKAARWEVRDKVSSIGSVKSAN